MFLAEAQITQINVLRRHLDRRERSAESREISPFGRDDKVPLT